MDLLITVIGNAAVDPTFRTRFLNNPIDTVDHYGIRLTKGDFEMMQTVFGALTPDEKQQLDQAFSTLETVLYQKVPCDHPCRWSLYPPAELRAMIAKAA